MSERSRTIHWSDPRIGGQAALSSSGLEYFARIRSGELAPPPIMALIGFRLAELEAGRVVFEFEPAEYHYNPIGSVHGGVASTLLDSALGCAVHTTLERGEMYSTVSLQVHFVRPITDVSGTLRCEGRSLHRGRRHATSTGTLLDAQGRLHAHASCSCVISALASEDAKHA